MRPTLVPAKPAPRSAAVFSPLRRPRVLELIGSAHRYPVTTIVAGAGYGKTVALEQWMAGRDDCIHYRITESTRDIFDFALGFAGALGSTRSGRGAAAAVVAAQRSASPENDLAGWFLHRLRKFSGTILIDDFHVAASTDAAVSRLMTRLIESAPAAIHWVIATRDAAELPISSWIAYGKSQMSLGERELAFTLDEAREAAAFLQSPVTDAQLNELFAYTAGWPTGLAFALLGDEPGSDVGAVRERTQEMAYRYFAEQVLKRLDPADVTLLLDTCVLERIDIDALRALGLKEPRSALHRLRLQPSLMLRERDGCIQYHDLFRDFLRSLVARDDRKHARAWARAGKAYETLGDGALALRAYQTAGNRPAMWRLLERDGFNLIDRGQRGAVLRALTYLPHDGHARARHPLVLALRANCEANGGNTERAEVWYRQAISAARSFVERAEISLAFAKELVQRNRLDGIDILEPVLRDDLPVALRAGIEGTLATYYWQAGRPDQAHRLLARALDGAAGLGQDATRAELLHQAAYVAVLSGNDAVCVDHAMRSLEISRHLHLHGLCARTESVLYYAAKKRDDLAQATWWNKHMLRSATEAGDMLLRYSALTSLFDMEAERGNDAALASLREQLRGCDPARFFRASTSLLPALAMQAAWRGAFREALAFVLGTDAEQPTPARRALRAAEICLYAAACGERATADSAAQRASTWMQIQDGFETLTSSRAARIFVWLALADLILGRNASANRRIHEAEKYPRKSPRTNALVRAARAFFIHAETGSMDGEMEASFAALGDLASGGFARLLSALPVGAARPSASTLTPAEIETLAALDRYGDTKTTARQLNRSPHTVDWHVKSVLRKLGTRSRRDAIAQARERGLIPHH